MTRKYSIPLYISALLIIAVCLIITAGSFILKDLKYYTETTFDLIEQQTGYIVKAKDIGLTVHNGLNVTINQLSINEPLQKDLLLDCRSAQFKIKILPILKKEIIVARLIFNEPEISIFGVKDGNWTKISQLPFLFKNKTNAAHFFKFIFKPDKILIHNGRLLYKNSSKNVFTSLSHINGDINVIKERAEYDLNISAKHIQMNTTGKITLNTRFKFPRDDIDLEDVKAQGSLHLKDIPASGFIPDIKKYILPGCYGAKLNGAMDFSLLPGLKFNLTGVIKPVFPAQKLQNGFFINASVRGSKDRIFIDKLDLALPGISHFTGTGCILDMVSDKPDIHIDIGHGKINIESLKKSVQFTKFPATVKGFLDKFISGNAVFNQTLIESVDSADSSASPLVFKGTCKLLDVKIALSESFPQVNIEDSSLVFTPNSLKGEAKFHVFKDDNSTAQIDIINPFHKPEASILFKTIYPVQRLNNLANQLMQSPLDPKIIQDLEGTVSAVTKLHFDRVLNISSDINLTSAAYTVKQILSKPLGVPNTLKLSAVMSNTLDNLTYDFNLDNAADFHGTIDTLKPFSLKGAYRLNKLNLNSISLLKFPGALKFSGKISGQGKYRLPLIKNTVLPFTGKLELTDLVLTDKLELKNLFYLNATSIITENNVDIENFSAKIGISDLSIKGDLRSAVPPKGDLRLNVDSLDIDDIVKVIRRIIILAGSGSRPKQKSRSNPFTETALTFDLHVKKGNFLKWDFDNATSCFTYNGSRLTWDNIHLSTDTGRAQGKVIYDYTVPGQYLLEFHPTKTSIDFTTLLPMFKKNQKFTGQTDLTGSFTSEYSKGSEIIPNMEALFHIQVKDGVIRRSKIISESIGKVSQVNKLNPDAYNKIYKNMPFTSVDADFKLNHGIMRTDDLYLTSPAINLTAIGEVNLNKGTIDFTVGTQVLKTIGKFLGNIPIAGNLFTIDNKALTLGYFHVSGPFDKPEVKALPFKSLGLGIKHLFMSLLDIPLSLLQDSSNNNKEPANP